MKSQHMVIIIDNNKKVDPKKYVCFIDEKTKEDAIHSAKKAYETKYQNYQYESYYFENK